METVKVRTETQIRGAFKVVTEYRGEDAHKGIFHKLFCNITDITTYHYCTHEIRVMLYECGHEITKKIRRLEDAEDE